MELKISFQVTLSVQSLLSGLLTPLEACPSALCNKALPAVWRNGRITNAALRHCNNSSVHIWDREHRDEGQRHQTGTATCDQRGVTVTLISCFHRRPDISPRHFHRKLHFQYQWRLEYIPLSWDDFIQQQKLYLSMKHILCVLSQWHFSFSLWYCTGVNFPKTNLEQLYHNDHIAVIISG